MRNDKEFKAKNRDESYVKDKRPDIQLGRHTEGEKQKPPLTQSKKNRMYRARVNHPDYDRVYSEIEEIQQDCFNK